MKLAPKVFFLVSKADVGGATTYVHNLKKEFPDSSLTYLYGGNSKNRIESEGKILLDKEKLSGLDWLYLLFKLSSFIRSAKGNVISVHSTEASLLLRMASIFYLGRPKIVFTVHGWGWRGKNRLLQLTLMFIEYLLYHLTRCHYIFLYPGMSKENWFMTYFADRFDVVLTGKNIKSETEVVCNRKNNKVLFPARLDYAKRHVDALKILLQSSELTLTYVGHGTDSKEFKEVIAEKCYEYGIDLSRIEFYGLARNISDLYTTHGIVLLISRFEALPMVLLEGASFGCLCIANNVGGNALIIRDLDSGLLLDESIELRDEQYIFLTRYLSDDLFAKNVSSKAKRLVNLEFSKSEMIKSYSNIFSKI